MKIKYPKPLKKGDKIGITAPSSGVTPEHYARLDLVLNNLRTMGFQIVEGSCLRQRHKHVSGPKQERAREFVQFWKDPSIKAIMPPWGGEILVEILPLIDFNELSQFEPKWISGYSDISTLLLPLTTLTGIATVHGSNLMELSPAQTNPLTTGLIKVLQLPAGSEFTEEASSLYQSQWVDFKTQPEAALNLTEPTQWKVLQGSSGQGEVRFSGRLIGGCLDTIARLVGTPYADLPRFYRNFSSEGIVLYFENCEMAPCELVRTLWNIKLAGWFEGISGILIGRSSGPEAKTENDLSYIEALLSVLEDIKVPIIYDMDIGHRPPQLNIINGAVGTLEFHNNKGHLKQQMI